MRNARLVLAVLVSLLLGFAAGYWYRRWKYPTFEERSQEAAEDFRRGMEKLMR